MSFPRVATVLVALFVLCSASLFAQFTSPRRMGGGLSASERTLATGDDDVPRNTSLAGSVRTISDRPVSDAKVEVREIGTGAVVASAYTSFSGNFELRDLRQGTYEVTATSGVLQARERVELRFGEATLNLRIADSATGSGGGPTVSVANLKVPGKAKNALHKAEEYVQKGRLDDARKEVGKALQVYPTYAEAYTYLGIIDLDQQKVPEATANLEKAIQYDPNSAMAFLVLASAYNVSSKYDDALRALDSGVRLAPQSWQAYFEMAKAYLGKSDFSSALQQVTKAEQLAAPREFPAIHLVKANALLGLKEYNRAVAELEVYLARNPKGPSATEARQTLDQVKAFTGTK